MAYLAIWPISCNFQLLRDLLLVQCTYWLSDYSFVWERSIHYPQDHVFFKISVSWNFTSPSIFNSIPCFISFTTLFHFSFVKIFSVQVMKQTRDASTEPNIFSLIYYTPNSVMYSSIVISTAFRPCGDISLLYGLCNLLFCLQIL